MNAIINWLALNNTLMIKIGFSAIILLIVVYVFRFFFVPRVKVISDVADLSEVDDISPAKSDVVKEGAVSLNSEDVTKLQAEISTLKYKLKEAEAEKITAVQAAAGEGKVTSSPSSSGLDMVAESNTQNAAVQTELEEKIKMLEARLSEYEIIAEDIAEISKLRQENEELKTIVAEGGVAPAKEKSKGEAVEVLDKAEAEVDLAQFLASEDPVFEEASTNQAATETSEAAEVVEPVEAVPESADDSQLLEEYAAAKTAAEVDDSSRIVITSDVEISAEEKNSLNEFEQFKKMKKG